MPGKHAPESPSSFYVSVGRAVVGALAVLGLVVGIVVVMVSSGDDGKVAAPRPSVSSAAPTGTASATPTTSPTTSSAPSLRPRSKVTIVVMNGAGVPGLAARVQDKLEKAGYNVIRIGNAQRVERTTVYFKPSAEADADALVNRYDEFGRARPVNSSSAKDALITIIVGRDYPS